MVVFEEDLVGSERFSRLIGEPGQRDSRLPCIPIFVKIHLSPLTDLLQRAEAFHSTLGARVVQSIDQDPLLAPESAGESRVDFPAKN